MLSVAWLRFAKDAACPPVNILKTQGFNKATSILFSDVFLQGEIRLSLNKSDFFLSQINSKLCLVDFRRKF